jgi:VanZ family protein
MEESQEPASSIGGTRLTWPWRLCLLALALAVVYWLGTSLFSAVRMEPLFYPFFRAMFHVGEPGQLFHYLSLVRWTAHCLEYFALFMLLVWLVGLRPLTALLFCVILAGADEGHQYFLPDRSCSLRDLTLDAAGAATAFILTIAARRLRAAPRLQANAIAETPQTPA